MNFTKIREQIFSFKLPMRTFSLFCILLLLMVTMVLTYKSILDIAAFFKFEKQLSSKHFRWLLISTSFIIGFATVVQGMGFIWDRLSYWGQCIDNFILYYLTNQIYFIDQVELLISEARKLINATSSELQTISWALATGNNVESPSNLINKLDVLLNSKIADADKKANLIIELLKNNEPYDNINRTKKNAADLNLNALIIQLTETCARISSLKKELRMKEHTLVKESELSSMKPYT